MQSNSVVCVLELAGGDEATQSECKEDLKMMGGRSPGRHAGVWGRCYSVPRSSPASRCIPGRSFYQVRGSRYLSIYQFCSNSKGHRGLCSVSGVVSAKRSIKSQKRSRLGFVASQQPQGLQKKRPSPRPPPALRTEARARATTESSSHVRATQQCQLYVRGAKHNMCKWRSC